MYKTVLLYSVFVTTIFAKKCVVPLGVKTEWPLLFHQNGSFYPSEIINGEEVAIIPNKDYVILSCSPNYFKESPEVKKIIATCRSGNLTGGTLAPKANLACKSSPVEETIAEFSDCPEGKTPVRIGYVHPIDNSAHIIGEACYNTQEGRTLFAHFRLGSEEFTSMEVVNKNFFDQKKPDLRYKANFMYAFYRKVYELASWTELNDSAAPSYIPAFETDNFIDGFLLRNVQLAPVNELSWNFVILNSAVENFRMLKKDIRDLKDDIDVYIGSYGVLKFKNVTGVDGVPIYLDPERFPVPEAVWTVVRKENKATAFVIFNDPTLTEADVSNNPFCDSKCHSVGWLKNTRYDDPTQGGVLCCEYEELRARVDEVPELSVVSELYV